MNRSNVIFVEAKNCNDVVINKHTVVFSDGVIRVGAESKELLCVGDCWRNVKQRRVKVQFVGVAGATRSRPGQTRAL